AAERGDGVVLSTELGVRHAQVIPDGAVVGRLLSGARQRLLGVRIRAPPVLDPAESVENLRARGRELVGFRREEQRFVRLLAVVDQDPGQIVEGATSLSLRASALR